MKSIEGFDFYVRTTPDAPFILSELGDFSHAQADARVNAILNGLSALGLKRTDHVGVVARNRWELLLLFLASLRGGPVFVPINNRLAPNEMVWILENAECTAFMAEEPFVEALTGKVPADIPAERIFSFDGAKDGWRDFAELYQGQPETDPGLPIHEDDTVLQIYTSGTTGLPKGVMLTEKNSQNFITGVLTASDLDIMPGDRLYSALPLFHVGGIVTVQWMMNRGASILLRRDFNPVEVEDLLATDVINRAVMVPAMIQACLMAGGDSERDFSTVKSISYGASPISSAVLKGAAQRYGCEFSQIYGMSETYAVGTMLSAADHKRALSNERPDLVAAAGRPLAGCTITIRDPEGNALPTGEVGEICIKSESVMKGYWRRDDATAESIKNGEMHTGDAGRMDEEGYVFIVDRIKDIIVSGGENVSSIEVEEVLMRHPAIAEAAVIGVPDPKWGEAIKAIIATAEEISDEDIIAYCREHLGGFKIPKSVDRIDALPRNGTGKVLKVKLREPYWEGVERRVS